MSKRALWLAFGALSVGFVVVSCTGSDGTANFDATGGDGSAGDDASSAGSSAGGTPNTGGSSAQAGADPVGEGGSSSTSGGQGTGEAGAPAGGGSANAGQPGAGAGGAGGGGPGRPPCESLKDCDEGQVCVKPTCDEQKEGVCADAPAAPVCGCDGVTYYNGALAVGAAQDVRANGTCKGETAVTCDGDCKEGLTCGSVELRDGNCEAKVGGVCWQLPAQCPALDLTLYNLCGSEKCLSLCEAVHEGAHAVPGGLACPVIN